MRRLTTTSDAERARVEYLLLGSVGFRRDGESIDLGVYKQRALFAMLLIHANQVVSTDRLIDELWRDAPGGNGRNAMWVNVSRLRTALEPNRQKRSDGTILVTRSPGYQLSVDPSEIDSVRFESLADEGRGLLNVDPAAASLVLREGLSLWRGHALEEFTYESFAQAEIARLEELRLTAVEDRVLADLQVGRARELVGELEGLVREQPLRERLTEHLMLALYRSGRQGDALRAFGRFRDRLREDLGFDPPDRVTRLEERIVQDDPSLRLTPDARPPGVGHPSPGLPVRGYELREKLGDDSLGEVYRAYQPVVGREVTVRVIRPDLANDQDFIRRFEAEAQRAARIENPHVAPVFDYWREPDAAYVVSRRFERGSLRDALAEGPLSTEAALRVVSGVAGALDAAHRLGVTHGGVSPSSILLDEDRNAYLTDFTTSFVAERGAGGSSVAGRQDSAFAAPEVGDSGGLTRQSDVYSLGMIAAAVLRGAKGSGSFPDAPLMGQVASVIAGATADDPAERYASAASFLAALNEAIGVTSAACELVQDVENPYRGLRAFEEEDAGRFFGRERLVERLIARLGTSGAAGRFVALVGPSGAGKSSVVRAGLIPVLRSAALPGSDAWFTVALTPGPHPFEALAEALVTLAVDRPPDLVDQLISGGIGAAVDSIVVEPTAQLVIVVDQLEELFSHSSVSDAHAFLSALAEVVSDRHSRVKVVTTLRADFYDHPLRHQAFGELLRFGTEVITPMTAEELAHAVSAPAAGVGVSFAPGLVARIVSDMAGQPAALPLMQHALTELFQQRSGATIPEAAYRELGGVSGALVRRAERLYESFDDEERAAARDVFLRLVTLGDGSDDTRRRVLRRELVDRARRGVDEVLHAFGRHRLLSFDRDPATRGPTVEITHEALLTEWERLGRWIADARSDIGAQRRLGAALADWRERWRNDDYLLVGARLDRYEGWVESPPVHLTADELEFLTASEKAAEAERRSERRRARRLRRLVGGIGLGMVIALVAGGVALREQRRANDEALRAQEAAAEARRQTDLAEIATAEAEDQAAQAEHQSDLAVAAATEAELATLISRSAAVSADDADLSLLLALEAVRRRPGPATEQAVLDALGQATIGNLVATRTPLPGTCVGFSIFWNQDHGAREFDTIEDRIVSRDPVTGTMTDHGQAPGPCAVGYVDEQAGTAMAVAPGGLQHWVGADWQMRLEFEQLALPLWVTATRYLTLTPGTDVQAANIWDVPTGRRVGASFEGGVFLAMDASADGSQLALSFARPAAPEGDGRVFVVDATTGAELQRLDFRDAAEALLFDDESGEVVAGFLGGRVLTIDPTSGAIVADVQSGLSDFLDFHIRDDGVVVAVGRGGIQELDRRAGPLGRAFGLRDVTDARVRPDGTVLTQSPEGQIDVLDLTGSALVEQVWRVDPSAHVGVNAGQAAILNAPLQRVEILDLATGDRSQVALTTPDRPAFDTVLAVPGRDGFWTFSLDHVAARWEGGRMVEEIFMGSEPGVEGIRYGRSVSGNLLGDRFAVLGRRVDGSQEATLISLLPGETGVQLAIPTSDALAVHPSVEGGLHIADGSGVLRTYDDAGGLVGEVSTGVVDPILAVDAATGLVAVGDFLGGVVVVDPRTHDVEAVAGREQVNTLGFGRDGAFLAIGSRDGTVRLWDVERGALAGVAWEGAGFLGLHQPWYDTASESIWIGSSGQLIKVPLNPAGWVRRACDVVGRDFTQEEWDRLVPGDAPLQPACG